jgi:hypothetical protein
MDINERIQNRLNLFSHYYKAKYGNPIGKIALSAGVECPNRQTGGCVYCSPASFTPFYLEEGDSVATQLTKGKQYLHTRKFRQYFGYFQQETTTAAPEAQLIYSCTLILSDPDCIGLIISTRPDYIESSFLQELQSLVTSSSGEKEIIFELGLQTAQGRSLLFLNRNHTFADFVCAAEKIKQFTEFELGVHLILGLPGETFEDMLETVKLVSLAGVGAIKFHHLQVIRKTRLHQMYNDNPFKVYSAREYLEILAGLIPWVPQNVVLHRLWSSSDRDILVAPDWGGLGAHQLNRLLLGVLEEGDRYQGKALLPAAVSGCAKSVRGPDL